MKHERVYLDKNDERVYIDTYVADGSPRPAMLVIPGGGYVGVSHFLEGEPIALKFLEKGYNTFELNYRVGKSDNYPKQLTDAAKAMIYIRENAESLSVFPDKVYAVGFSAGGHLTGSLATMFDNAEMKAEFGDKCDKIRPDAVILSYPVITAIGACHQGSFANLLGKPYADLTEEEKRSFSIECLVNDKTPPVFIWHTAEDKCVPPIGSVKMAAALDKAACTYKVSIYPYGPHALGLGEEDPFVCNWVSEACDFIGSLK